MDIPVFNTLLPEALEKWLLPIMEKVLPRHLHIIYRINDDFLKKAKRKWNGIDDNIRRVMDTFNSDLFCLRERGIFKWIYDSILDSGDPYFHLADLQAYSDKHDEVRNEYVNTERWLGKCVLNVSRMGKFSSDRTINQYASEIWGISPVTD